MVAGGDPPPPGPRRPRGPGVRPRGTRAPRPSCFPLRGRPDRGGAVRASFLKRHVPVTGRFARRLFLWRHRFMKVRLCHLLMHYRAATRALFIADTILLLYCPHLGAQPAPTADEIVARHIEARGGADKIRGIRTLV